jgi:hypothetical protein
VVAADDDRISVLCEARYNADVSTTSAAHCDDSSNLRSDMTVTLPGDGSIVHILRTGNFPQEGRAPEGATNTNLSCSISEILTGSVNKSVAI